MTKVAILQSNYIPWKGYFDIIHDVDLFVFYDDLQYTKNDWRNRNRIKTPNGADWLTIPVGEDSHRLICDVEIKNPLWQTKHWKTFQQYYCKCPHFARYRTFLEEVYMGKHWRSLSDLNQYLIKEISRDFLAIKTTFKDSREYALSGLKLERLMDLVIQSGASSYVSGPAAKDYIDPGRFNDRNIKLIWKDYSGYPEYPQIYPPFKHAVTVLDLLFNVGPDAPWYIWGWRKGGSPLT